MTLKERIQAGIDGKFQGLANGFQRANEFLFGTQRGTYYLLGGLSGTYKSMLCDFIVQNGIRDAKMQKVECNVFYYSFEIDGLSKRCNWLANAVYHKYGVVVPTEKIKGMGYNPNDPNTFHRGLNKDEKLMVDSCVEEVDAEMDKIHFRFDPTNPTGIYHELWKFAESKGKILYENYSDQNGEIKQKVVGYIPHNPDAYNIIVLDHAALTKKERGFQTKEVIDKLSEYFINFRNLFGFTIILVQQFNQGLSSIERQKFKGVDISPQQSDFRDSTNPYNDADVVLGIMNAARMDMTKCLNYDIVKLGDNFIMLKIIKNRLSKDNIAIGLYAVPKGGYFIELPKADVIDYSKYN